MSGYRHRFPQYGTIGLILLLVMETAIFCSWTNAVPNVALWKLTAWATPVCWWAYILIVDACIYRRRGTSLLTARRQSLTIQCILSVAFWCLFEAYNRVLPGWRYVNLFSDLSLRLLGYAISFATIMPGLFLTCELLQSYDVLSNVRVGSIRWNNFLLNVSVFVGVLFVLAPPFMAENLRGYLWAFVWIGWVLLLEPFNYWRGAQSIYRDWEHGDWSRTLQLMMAGAICGFLWEFWNMWAYTKWVYIFPHGNGPKLFEMPLVGFLGFLAFAVEYFVMYHFIASAFTNHDTLEI